MTFDVEGLQGFIARGEKSPPPVFVGRENVLGDIEKAGRLAWKRRNPASYHPQPTRHGAPKNTRIIQGAPGAGKSSILAELVKRSGERDGAPGQSRVVTLSTGLLMTSLPKAIRMIAVAAGMPQEWWRRHSGSLSFGVDALLASAEDEMSWARDPDNAPENLNALAARLAPAKWQAPVIVAVDEAQRLPGPMHAQHALFLQGIHDADSGLPLNLVLAGLGDTRDAANAMDMISGLTIHEIGGLEAGESATLMRDFCRHFGIDPEGHEVRLDALAAPCEGWPSHLHHALQALAQEALRCDGDLERVDWDRIGTAAAESRTRYCLGQQSAEMDEADGLTAVVMSRLEDGMKMSGVLRLIEENLMDVAGHRLPKGLSSKGFYTHLAHCGALQKREDGTVHCPIPSFRTYLIRAGGL